jgi:hypothetical protein
MDADRNGVTPLTAVSETDVERQRRVDRAAERGRARRLLESGRRTNSWVKSG